MRPEPLFGLQDGNQPDEEKDRGREGGGQQDEPRQAKEEAGLRLLQGRLVTLNNICEKMSSSQPYFQVIFRLAFSNLGMLFLNMGYAVLGKIVTKISTFQIRPKMKRTTVRNKSLF